MHTLIRTSFVTLLLVGALALVAGCSDDGSTGEVGKPSNEKRSGDLQVDGEPIGEQADAKLDVKIENVGSKSGAGIPVPSAMRCTRSIPATCTTTVECPVAGDSNDNDARSVCAWLATDGLAVLTEAPDAHEICTQQYGGPEVATVTGTLEGTDVSAEFSRENGCAIGRFDSVSPLWTGEVDSASDKASQEPEAIDDPPSAFDE